MGPINRYAAGALYILAGLAAMALTLAVSDPIAELIASRFESRETATTVFMIVAAVLCVYPGMVECKKIWHPLFGSHETPVGAISLGIVTGFLIRLSQG